MYNHFSAVWHIDLGATSHICAYRSMFQEYQKVEQTSAIWTGVGSIKANWNKIRTNNVGMLKWSNPRDYAERSITCAWIYDQSSFINIFTQKRSISIGDQTISHIG